MGEAPAGQGNLGNDHHLPLPPHPAEIQGNLVASTGPSGDQVAVNGHPIQGPPTSGQAGALGANELGFGLNGHHRVGIPQAAPNHSHSENGHLQPQHPTHRFAGTNLNLPPSLIFQLRYVRWPIPQTGFGHFSQKDLRLALLGVEAYSLVSKEAYAKLQKLILSLFSNHLAATNYVFIQNNQMHSFKKNETMFRIAVSFMKSYSNPDTFARMCDYVSARAGNELQQFQLGNHRDLHNNFLCTFSKLRKNPEFYDFITEFSQTVTPQVF